MKTIIRCGACKRELKSEITTSFLNECVLSVESCHCIEEKNANYVGQMEEFHKVFGVPISDRPVLLGAKDAIRRLTLITSEVGELGDWVRQENIVEIADALGDLLYVTFGMAVEMGLNIDRVFTEIHQSNMTKANADGSVTRDEGGKILKSKEYKPVDLSWIKILWK